MQAHARVCEENKRELELEKKTNAYRSNRNNFMMRGTSLKDHMERVGKRIEIILSRMIYHNIKVLLLYLVKY